MNNFIEFWGLDHHPEIISARSGSGLLPRKPVQLVFYHADVLTKHASFKELLATWRKRRDSHAEEVRKAKSRKWKRDTLVAPPPDLRSDMTLLAVANSQIMNKDKKTIATAAVNTPDCVWDAAVRFVQLQAKRKGSDRVFSCALAGRQSIESLRDRASNNDKFDGDGGALTLFAGFGDGEVNSLTRLLEAARTDPLKPELPAQVFFHISSSHPKLKELLVSLSARGIASHDVAICVRNCTYLDCEFGQARVALDEMQTPGVWTLPKAMTLSQFRVCICEWKELPEYSCSFVNESMLGGIDVDIARDFFMRCLDAGAFLQDGDDSPENDEVMLHLNHMTREGLALYECGLELRNLNFVKLIYDFPSTRSSWVVTGFGNINVRYDQKLSYQGIALAPRMVPNGQLQSWEFMQLLFGGGWGLFVASAGVASKAIGGYTAGDPKRFFVRDKQKALCRVYLFLLCIADDKALTVPHLRKASFYQQEFADYIPQEMKKKHKQVMITKPFDVALEDAQRQDGNCDEDADDGADVQPGANNPSEDDDDGVEVDDVPPIPLPPPEDIERNPQPREPQPATTTRPRSDSPSSSSTSSSSSSSSTSSSSDSDSGDDEDDTKKKKLQWPNHMWGDVLFSYKPMNDGRSANQWVATCPFCPAATRDGKNITRCTRTLMVAGEGAVARVDGEEDVLCRQRLKFWAVAGRSMKDKKKHQKWHSRWRAYLSTLEIPAEDELVRRRDTEPPAVPATSTRRALYLIQNKVFSKTHQETCT